jgi:hypothetical protein
MRCWGEVFFLLCRRLCSQSLDNKTRVRQIAGWRPKTMPRVGVGAGKKAALVVGLGVESGGGKSESALKRRKQYGRRQQAGGPTVELNVVGGDSWLTL